MESLPAKTHILRVDRLDGDLTNKNGGLVGVVNLIVVNSSPMTSFWEGYDINTLAAKDAL